MKKLDVFIFSIEDANGKYGKRTIEGANQRYIKSCMKMFGMCVMWMISRLLLSNGLIRLIKLWSYEVMNFTQLMQSPQLKV